MTRSKRNQSNRAQALEVLERLLRDQGNDDPQSAIGRIRHLGDGLTYRVFATVCRVQSAHRFVDVPLVVRLPRHDAPGSQRTEAAREAQLLERLSKHGFPHRIPEVIGSVNVSTGVAQIQRRIAGIPLELKAAHGREVRPWEPVARVAASCHSLDPRPYVDLLPGYSTRRAHAQARIDALGRVARPEFSDARSWAALHLPPDSPARLLHGDLLGQNILLPLSGQEEDRIGVIDWAEAQLGDPAYDLAIVTRGKRRPFRHREGFRNLLEAYNAISVDEVTAAEVRLHELCLLAEWCADAWRSEPDAGHTEQLISEFRGLFRRVVRQ